MTGPITLQELERLLAALEGAVDAIGDVPPARELATRCEEAGSRVTAAALSDIGFAVQRAAESLVDQMATAQELRDLAAKHEAPF